MPAVSSRGRGRRTINEINMVPFIDVMLVLLIIFMVTAPLITPSVINLPTVDRAAQRKDNPLEVVVDKNEVVRFSRDPSKGSTAQEYRLSELGQAVKAAQDGDAQRPVVISAEKEVKYDTVVQVMRTLNRAGIERVGLSVTASGGQR